MTPPAAARPWLEIVVPARNEEARLPRGLAELASKAAELQPGVSIIVVDNASTDGTADIVRAWPEGPVLIRLLTCAFPGKGAAVRAGFMATRAPYVGFCDADMATDLDALDVAVELLRGGSQLIIGSRSHPESDVEDRHNLIRRSGAAAFRRAARAVAPGVGDTQCGFKFMAGPVARAVATQLRSTGFSFDIELIARCRQLGVEATEIPVRWRDVRGSTFSVWRHSMTAFAEIVAIWLAVRAGPERYADSERRPAPDAESAAQRGLSGESDSPEIELDGVSKMNASAAGSDGER